MRCAAVSPGVMSIRNAPDANHVAASRSVLFVFCSARTSYDQAAHDHVSAWLAATAAPGGSVVASSTTTDPWLPYEPFQLPWVVLSMPRKLTVGLPPAGAAVTLTATAADVELTPVLSVATAVRL